MIALEKMAEAFRQSDPQYANVTIEFTAVPFEQLFPTIETAVAAGAEMDLFAADGPDIKHYAYNEAIVPLAEYYTEEELAEWVPQSVEEGSFNGTFYAPPLMQSCSLMFYNKDMTDAAGLEPPQAVQGWTMDEAWDAWLKTTVDDTGDGVPDVWGLRWGQGYLVGRLRARHHAPLGRREGQPDLPGRWAPTASPSQGYLDTPEAIASFEDYRAWHQGDRAVTPREPIDNIFFSKGAAFYVSPDNAIGTINRLYPDGDFNYGVTGIPYYADGAQVCHTGSWHFGVSPQTTEPGALRGDRQVLRRAGRLQDLVRHRAPAAGARRPAQHAAGVQRVPAAALQRGVADHRHPAHPDAGLHRVPADLRRAGARHRAGRRRRSGRRWSRTPPSRWSRPSPSTKAGRRSRPGS